MTEHGRGEWTVYENSTSHVRESRNLPPVTLRAEGFEDPNSRTFERLATPLNEIGLVDKPRLIKLVRGTLNAAYMWPSELDDEHHYQWPRKLYPNDPEATITRKTKSGETHTISVNPYEFRNYALNKTYWPRTFHNWAHKVTEHPPLPTLDVMFNVGQAQLAIDTMHRSVQIAKMLYRNKHIPPHSLNSRLDELFEEYHVTLDDLSSLPPEFHFIDIDNFKPDDVHDLLNIKGELGRLATVPTIASTTRHIRQSSHRSASAVPHNQLTI
jgi:hypothetical protein